MYCTVYCSGDCPRVVHLPVLGVPTVYGTTYGSEAALFASSSGDGCTVAQGRAPRVLQTDGACSYRTAYCPGDCSGVVHLLDSGVHTVYGTIYDGEAVMFASAKNDCAVAQGGDSNGVYATSNSSSMRSTGQWGGGGGESFMGGFVRVDQWQTRAPQPR